MLDLVDEEGVVLSIDVVSFERPAQDAYTSNTPKNHGGGARLITISLPRVKWLERPDLEEDDGISGEGKVQED